MLRDLVLVLAETALRIGEAIGIRFEDVDGPGKTLRVYAPKTNRWEFVPLNESALAILLARKLSAGAKGLIFTSSTGGPLCRRNARVDLIEAGKRAGVQITGPHMLRRSCLTHAAKSLMPSQLKEFARHKDIRTTQSFYVGKPDVKPPVLVPSKAAQ